MPPRPPRKRPAPAKQEVTLHETVIESLDEEGLGFARFEGKELRIPGVFPGEKVSFSVDYRGQRRMGGKLQRILEQSPDRIKPVCRQERSCLGCPLIALNYSAQLRIKRDSVLKALRSHSALKSVEVLQPLAAQHPFGYRTHAKLVLSKVHGKVKIGIYRRGSHEVVDLRDCPLHHPLINRIIKVVREEIEHQKVWVYDARKKKGLLRYLMVRVSPDNNQALVTFVTAERNYREITHLAKWLTKKVPEVVSVHQNINASDGNVMLGRESLKMLGHQTLRDRVGETRIAISPASFFQVNHEQAERIYALVRKWAALAPYNHALDLYCGIGGIALGLARDAARVIGIEVVEEAVRNARDNARLNKLDNCRFMAGDTAELLEDLQGEFPPDQVVTVNPPRKGVEKEALEAIAGFKPRTIIYVSCNPETLARDLANLHTLGYATECVQPVDMFPQTPHIENVARLVPLQGS